MLLLACVLLVNCGGKSTVATPTTSGAPPSQQPVVERTPSLTATPLSVSSVPAKGLFVVARNKDLWLVSLDNPAIDRQLTQGSRGVGYAGAAVNSGTTYVYYTSDESGDGTTESFGVYRVALPGGQPERLFQFEGGPKQLEFSCCNATLAPDGQLLAYSDKSGIRVHGMVSWHGPAVRAQWGAVWSGARLLGEFLPPLV